MCDACIIARVKEKMLSRRTLIGGALAASVPVAMPASGATPRTACRFVDMTHKITPDFPTYYGYSGLQFERLAWYGIDGYNSYNLMISEHLGTHIDAPLHFSADGKSVDEIALLDLVCPLVVIDISARAADDADTMLASADIESWTERHGPIPDGAVVAMNSDWAAKVAGPGFRNTAPDGSQHYPGFHPEAASMLLEETNTAAIACDTLSRCRSSVPLLANVAHGHYRTLATLSRFRNCSPHSGHCPMCAAF